MNNLVISFTGRRPQFLGGYDDNTNLCIPIKKKLKELLIELKPDKCISGMAIGTDTFAFEVCLELNIPVIAVIPFMGQESKWTKEAKERYNNLLSKAVEKIIVCPGGYAAWKMQERNKWMVDNSDLVIAIYDGGKTGGTANCVNYAKSKNKRIIIIDPNKL